MATSFDTTFRVVILIIVFSTVFVLVFFSSVICLRFDSLCIFSTRNWYVPSLTTTLHARRVSLIHVILLPHSGEVFASRAIFNLTNIFMRVLYNLLIE